MSRHINIFVVATALSVTAGPHCFAGQWMFRPGLWRARTFQDGQIVHIPPNASDDMRAKLRAMALPKVYSQQVCVRPGSKPGASFFDPESQPSGICSEKGVYKDADVEIVVSDCLTPHLMIGGTDFPSITAKTTRYVSLKKPARGMVWGIDSVVQNSKIRVDVKHTLRWIDSKC